MNTRRRLTTEFLKYRFTEKEKQELSGRMAMKAIEVEEVEAEKKSVTASFKERIESAQLEVRQCATKIKDGYEYRHIECEEVSDYSQGLISIYRTDTGELVRTRVMTQAERQMHIDDAFGRESPDFDQEEMQPEHVE